MRSFVTVVSSLCLCCFAALLLLFVWVYGGAVSEYSIYLFGADEQDQTIEVEEHERSGTATISGLVLHADGEGIQNARVHLAGGAYEGTSFTYTNEAGRFEFHGVPLHAEYRITVKANGLVMVRNSVELSLHGEQRDLVFTAQPIE